MCIGVQHQQYCICMEHGSRREDMLNLMEIRYEYVTNIAVKKVRHCIEVEVCEEHLCCEEAGGKNMIKMKCVKKIYKSNAYG